MTENYLETLFGKKLVENFFLDKGITPLQIVAM
jgi:hypothetical protein